MLHCEWQSNMASWKFPQFPWDFPVWKMPIESRDFHWDVWWVIPGITISHWLITIKPTVDGYIRIISPFSIPHYDLRCKSPWNYISISKAAAAEPPKPGVFRNSTEPGSSVWRYCFGPDLFRKARLRWLQEAPQSLKKFHSLANYERKNLTPVIVTSSL